MCMPLHVDVGAEGGGAKRGGTCTLDLSKPAGDTAMPALFLHHPVSLVVRVQIGGIHSLIWRWPQL